MQSLKVACLLSLCVLILSSCTSDGTYDPPTSGKGDESQETSAYTNLSQKSLREIAKTNSVEQSRKICYTSIVAVEEAKTERNDRMFTLLTSVMSEDNMAPEMKMMGLMMMQQAETNTKIIEMALGTKQRAPFACNQMGVYEYKLAMSQTRWKGASDIGGKLLKFGLIGFGVDKAFDLGSLVINKLAEPRIQSGANSTNILGNSNTLNNAGGACAGEVVDGTCITPEIVGGEAVETSDVCPATFPVLRDDGICSDGNGNEFDPNA